MFATKTAGSQNKTVYDVKKKLWNAQMVQIRHSNASLRKWFSSPTLCLKSKPSKDNVFIVFFLYHVFKPWPKLLLKYLDLIVGKEMPWKLLYSKEQQLRFFTEHNGCYYAFHPTWISLTTLATCIQYIWTCPTETIYA